MMGSYTDKIKNEGFTLAEMCPESVNIIRSMFDEIMAAMLSGAGRASCQLFTSTYKELKYQQLIVQGFHNSRQFFMHREYRIVFLSSIE